jgi:glycosyltransferase involved in cell wall biosynthesis
MLSVSILIATYNRASIIRDTLSAMMEVDWSGIDAEWIVVNNNSSDETGEVLLSFQNKLPLRILDEAKPGKNAALNRALEEVPLRDILIFTDDDTTPRFNWLAEIVACCERWRDVEVFGGKIVLRWPNGGSCPDWLEGSWLLSLGFTEHDLGEKEKRYSPGTYPFGPNVWFKRSIFEQGRRFREEIGPIKTARIMGSETSFLAPLAEEGKEMIYCPRAVVEHRIKPGDQSSNVLFRRAYSRGRGTAHIEGVYRKELLAKSPTVWHMRQAVKLLLGCFRLLLGYCRFGRRSRIEGICDAYIYLGRTIETSRLSRLANAACLVKKRGPVAA